jgi:hypothetical protein
MGRAELRWAENELLVVRMASFGRLYVYKGL